MCVLKNVDCPIVKYISWQGGEQKENLLEDAIGTDCAIHQPLSSVIQTKHGKHGRPLGLKLELLSLIDSLTLASSVFAFVVKTIC